MLIEENKTNVRRFFAAASTGKMEVLDELIVPDFVIHSNVYFPFVRGRETLKNAMIAFRAAFPDATFTVEQIFAEEDKVMSHVLVRATHKGEWMGAAPTGKVITGTASATIRSAGGKIVEIWIVGDELALMLQLGLVAALG